MSTAAGSGSPSGEPERVNVHDFPDPKAGQGDPYGVYDLGRNTGWVGVGTDHDTAGFAVATLRRWWQQVGSLACPQADRLLVCADAGGSNGDRVRAWKTELARLAAETGRQITVCHLPPWTSKGNRIEHRLFSAISMNWRGRPLVSHEVLVELIGRPRPTRACGSAPSWTGAATPLGSRCATRSWQRCRWCGTSSTASGTTPSAQRHRNHHRRQRHQAGTPKRCADRRFPRSPLSVRGKGMRS
jgi:hypothetical protein